MTPEERLRAALAHRAGSAARNPDALTQIRARGRRRRWTTRLRVATTTAAAAVLVTGVALAATGDAGREPAPPVTEPTAIQPVPTRPATTEPAPATTEPAPATTAPATIKPATGPGIAEDEYVALLDDGRLVVASATTGQIRRTVLTTTPATDDVATLDVTLTPDRRSVYLTTAGGTGRCGPDGRIEHVNLATGERTPIATGRQADASPDGRHLVYVRACGDYDIVVRDATGAERLVHHQVHRDVNGYPGPWNLNEVLWHADGRRLWVVVGWENSTLLLLLDPFTATTTADGAHHTGEHTMFGVDRSGPSHLAFLHSCCYADEPGDNLLVVRSEVGAERVVVRAPRYELGQPEAGPGGDLLYVRKGRLLRYDAATGTSADLGASTAVARDW